MIDPAGAAISSSPQATRCAVAAWLGWMRSSGDPLDFEQIETERFDLRKRTEQRGAVFEHTREHGLTTLQLRRHRGKGGEGGRSESAAYPDRVQARRRFHANIVQPGPVSRRRRN